MGKRVPKFIASKYHGGASEFRKSKRHAIRSIIRQINFLRLGCAYFPSGEKDVDVMASAADRIKSDVSTRRWGK